MRVLINIVLWVIVHNSIQNYTLRKYKWSNQVYIRGPSGGFVNESRTVLAGLYRTLGRFYIPQQISVDLGKATSRTQADPNGTNW